MSLYNAESILHVCVSRISIEYNDGHYEVYELNTPISKHKTLQEAQWIKSVIEKEAVDETPKTATYDWGYDERLSA